MPSRSVQKGARYDDKRTLPKLKTRQACALTFLSPSKRGTPGKSPGSRQHIFWHNFRQSSRSTGYICYFLWIYTVSICSISLTTSFPGSSPTRPQWPLGPSRRGPWERGCFTHRSTVSGRLYMSGFLDFIPLFNTGPEARNLSLSIPRGRLLLQ